MTVRTNWKYSNAEAKAIFAALLCPEVAKQATLEHAESAVRQYLEEQRLKPPNMRKEIETLEKALTLTLRAFDRLSPEAQHCLGAPEFEGGLIPQLDGVRRNLTLYLSAASSAASRAPSAKRRPLEIAERNLVAGLRNAFVLAHEGRRNPRGWSDLLHACTDPIADGSLLRRRSPEAWRQLLASNQLVRPFSRASKLPRKVATKKPD